jgi:hypothetical protein
MSFSLNSPDGGTTWVLTFTDPSYIGGSLPDGAYALTITGSLVTNAASQAMTGTTTENFYRFYGDFEGTGVVDIGDFNIFAGLFGLPDPSTSPLWFVDYNADGVIDITDFNAFSQNFGLSAPMPSVITTNVATTIKTAAVAAPLVSTTTQLPAATKITQSSVLSGTANAGSSSKVPVASGHGSTKKRRHIGST